MASSDQSAYIYLQRPQSIEVVTAGFHELDIPQGEDRLIRLQPNLPATHRRGTTGTQARADGQAQRHEIAVRNASHGPSECPPEQSRFARRWLCWGPWTSPMTK